MIGDELRQRSRRFALDVIDLCEALEGTRGARIIGQLFRAGTGVAANHRAAGHSRSTREYIARVGVVIEEADESELWLDVLETKGHGPLATVSRLRQEATELRAIFAACRRTAIRRQKLRRAQRPS